MSAPGTSREMALNFDGWADSLPEAQRTAVKEQLDRAPDREAEKRKLTNIFYLSEQARLPLRTVNEKYDAVKASWAARSGWGDVWQKDEAFYGRVVDLSAKKRDEEVMRVGVKDETEAGRDLRARSLAAAAFDAGLDPKGSKYEAMVNGFQKFAGQQVNGKNSPWRAENAGMYWNEWVQIFERAHQVYAPAREAAEKAFPKLKAGGEYDAINDVEGLTDEQFKVFGREIRRLADKEGVQLNFTESMIAGPARIIGNTVLGTGELIGKLQAGQRYKAGEPATPPDEFGNAGKILTEEEAAALNAANEKEDRRMRRQAALRELQQGVVMPLDKDGFVKAAAVSAAESLGAMGVIAVPYAGLPIAAASYTNDAENKLVEDGVPADKARLMAPVIGAATAVLDRAELGILAAKLPGVNAVLQKWTSRPFLTGAARAATITGAEMAIEATQDIFLPGMVQDLARAIDNEVPAHKWGDMSERLSAASAEYLPGMLLLGLVGAGAASFRDIRNFRALASNPDLLKQTGFTPSHIAAITLAQDSKEAQDLVRQFWPERQPVVAKSATSDTILLPASLSDEPGTSGTPGDSALSNQDRPVDTEADGTAPGVLPEETTLAVTDLAETEDSPLLTAPEVNAVKLRRDDDGWRVITEDGTAIPAGTVEAALHMRESLQRATTEKEANAMVGIAEAIYDLFAAEGKKSRQDFTGDRVESQGGAVTRTTPAGKIEAYQFNTEGAAAELERELALAGAPDGLVQGSNWIAEDGTRMMQTHQSVEGAITMAHEAFEPRIVEIINRDGGARARQAMQVLVKTGLFAPEKQRAAEEKAFAERVQRAAAGSSSETEFRETMTELLVANWVGKRKDGRNFAAGSVSDAVDSALRAVTSRAEKLALGWFRAMLRAAREYLRGIFGLAAKLAKARREGKLKEGDDFTRLADEVMGLSEQRRHNEGVVKELNAAGEADMKMDKEAFSTAASDGKASVEMQEIQNGKLVTRPVSLSREDIQQRLREQNILRSLLNKLLDCLK